MEAEPGELKILGLPGCKQGRPEASSVLKAEVTVWQAKLLTPRRMRLNDKGAMLLQGNLPKTCRMNPILPVGVQMQGGAQECTNEQRVMSRDL